MGKIKEWASAWLAGIRGDATLVAGFASFLAVLDFLFWGGAVSAVARPYTSLQIFAFFTIPCFLVAGGMLVALGFSRRLRGRAEGAPGVTDLVEVLGVIGGMCALACLLAGSSARTLPLALTAALLGCGLASGCLGWGRALGRLEPGRLANVVGSACVLFPLASLAMAFSPALPKYLIAGVLACCSVTLRREVPGGRRRGEESAPAEAADTAEVPGEGAPSALRVWRAYGITSLSFASLGFVAGLSRMIALGNGANNLVVMLASPIFTLVAGLVMLVLWNARGRLVTPTGFYQAAFPFAASGFVLFSATGLGFGTAFACFANFFFEFMLVVITVHSLNPQEGRGALRLPSYCLALGSALLFACLGTVASLATREMWTAGLPGLALSVVVCIYVLSMALVLQMRESRGSARRTPELAAQGEATEPAADGADALERMESAIAAWAQATAREHDLTPREREILPLVVRGLDTPTIARELGVSDNTVRTHKKSLYRKLEVHSKQDLIDLMHTGR